MLDEVRFNLDVGQLPLGSRATLQTGKSRGGAGFARNKRAIIGLHSIYDPLFASNTEPRLLSQMADYTRDSILGQLFNAILTKSGSVERTIHVEVTVALALRKRVEAGRLVTEVPNVALRHPLIFRSRCSGRRL